MSEDRRNGLDPVRGITYGIILSVVFFWLPLFLLVFAWAKTGSQYVIFAAVFWVVSYWYAIARMKHSA